MCLCPEFSPEENLKLVINLKLMIEDKSFVEKILKEDKPKGDPDWIAFLERKIKYLDEQIKALKSDL